MKDLFLLSLAGMILSANAGADSSVPYKYTTCAASKNIKRPINSNEQLLFSEDCKTAYVLPPKTGKITSYKAGNLKVNRKTCDEVYNYRSALESAADAMSSKQSTIAHQVKQVESKLKRLETSMDNIFKTEEELDEAQIALEEVLAEESYLQAEVDAKQAQLDTCDSANMCNLYRIRLGKARKNLENQQRLLSRARSQVSRAEAKLNREQRKIDDYNERIEVHYTNIERQDYDLGQDIEKMNDLLNQTSKGLGVIVLAEYNLDTTNIIEEFKRLNPNIGITFSAAPIEQYKMSFNMSVSSEVDGDHEVHIPATSDPGLEFGDSMHLGAAPSGEATIALNTIAACAIMDENGNIDPYKLEDERLFSATFSYQYNAAIRANYSVSYNISQLYEVIKTSGSSGGFFSRKRWTSIHRNSELTSLFTIEFKNEGNGHLSRQDKENIRREERSFAVEQLYREFMNIANSEGQLPTPILGMPSANGATTAANELSKCPYLYCQVGAGVLRIADAIWGSTKASNHFRDERKFQYDMHFIEQRMVTNTGSAGYQHDTLD